VKPAFHTYEGNSLRRAGDTDSYRDDLHSYEGNILRTAGFLVFAFAFYLAGIIPFFSILPAFSAG
jgi:hypothetical protein